MKNSKTYTASDIQVHLGLNGVRAKPNMYIGETNHNGVFQILKEIVDNAVDECLALHNTIVGVQLEGNLFKVFDCGRGIPVDIHPTTKMSTLTTIFTQLHAGGKMSKETNTAYKNTSGTHGVGASVTNALSKKFNVSTFKNNVWYNQSFEEGKVVTELTKSKTPKVALIRNKLLKKEPVTIIESLPDVKIFGTSKLDHNQVYNYLEICSFLNPAVHFYFYSDEDKQWIEIFNPNGIKGLVEIKVQENKAEPFGKAFTYSNGDVSVALQWTASTDEDIESYVNGSNTSQGGTHLLGLSDAITNSLKKFAGPRSQYKPADLRAGLVAVINVGVESPKFSSQTKERLVTEETKKIVYDCLFKELTSFFNKNVSLAKKIISQANNINKLNEQHKNNQAQLSSIKTESKGKIILPSKLKVCTSKNPKEKELFIVEGDSAGGTAVRARDGKFQEILSLKGKPINVYTAKGTKALENEPVRDMLQSIGFSPNSKEQLERLRVGKVILLSDADPDGSHINVLLIAVLYRYMPQLIEKGMVYVVDTSLYQYYDQKTRTNIYGKSMSDLRQKVKGDLKQEMVTRIKGWGEVGEDVLREVAFGEKRQLLKLEPFKNKKEEKDFIDMLTSKDDGKAKLVEVF
jgi:DNA gyrase subunit B